MGYGRRLWKMNLGLNTPCATDSLVTGISHLVLLGTCLYRIWVTKKNLKVQRFKLRSNIYNYWLGLLALYSTAEPLFRLIMGVSAFNVDGKPGLAPYEIVTLVIKAVAWGSMFVVIGLETMVYVCEVRWFVRFSVLYALLGDAVLINLVLSVSSYYSRWFEWEATKKEDKSILGLKQSEKVLYQLELIEQQLAVTFSRDGSLLAVGGEDGKLRAFKWPSMESLLDVPGAHASVKNLDFSPDGKFLVSVGSGGPGRVWDTSSATNKASLAKEKDEVFGFCRFSQNDVHDQVLYVTAMTDRGGSIVKWNTTTWKRMSSKYIVRDPISAFNVSDDGKFLAIGTIQGDIYILNASNIKVHTVVKKAHLGLVTALAFSHDSRALASASLDSSARVTQIKEIKKNGFNIWIIILIILVAAALYYAKTEGYFV